MEDNRFNHILARCICSILILGFSQTAQAARFYKWVDDNGLVRYGDRLPPSFAKNRQEILNEQGVIVETHAAAKTPEQLARETRLQKEAQQKQQRLDEQAAMDKMLLDTYSSEDDIIMARDSKINAIDAAIRLAESRITRSRKTLDESRKQAAQTERAGKVIPKQLANSISNARNQISDNETFIKNKTAEHKKVYRSHEKSINHYRQLMGSAADQRTNTLVSE
ncbi:MAG: DUF4124 domain-containing protein [Gammaproteobacteria bacterium]